MLSPALFLVSLAAPPQSPDAVILQPDAVVMEDGSLQPGALVLLKRDRVLAVGTSVPQPAGAEVLRLHGVLAPGFVDAFTQLGLSDAANESTAAVTPGLYTADSVDRRDPVWRKLLAQGVTAVQVIPEPTDSGPGGNFAVNAVAGWSAVLAPGAADGQDLVSETQARQVFGLYDAPYNGGLANAGPVSLPGVLETLDGALAAGIPGLSEHGALFQVESAAAVRAAKERAKKEGFAAVYVARGDVGSYGGELANELVGLSALADESYSLHGLETWRRLHAAGAKVAFGSDRRSAGGSLPELLRTSAMAYARATGDPAAGLAAITRNAAALAGQGRERGRIAAGARADLVLWSGHPLDSSSRVLSVLVGGRTVYSAQQP